MGKIAKLEQEVSLKELLEAVNNIYGEIVDNEEENKSEIQGEGQSGDAIFESLATYAKDLVPSKVDAVAMFIDRESYAIKSESEYIKQLKAQLNKREEALKKIKEYFANLLAFYGYDGENRLRGNIAAIWNTPTFYVDDNMINEIPNEYKKVKHTFVISDEAFSTLDPSIKAILEQYKVSTEVNIDKDRLKKDAKTNIDLMTFIKPRNQLKLGKR